MKKLAFIIGLAVFGTTYAQAFDFHGIKSGMTKEEVRDAMAAIGATGYLGGWESFKSIAFPPNRIVDGYDHTGKLMQLQLVYRIYGLSSPALSALKSTLETRLKAVVLELEKVIFATVSDEDILSADLEYYRNKFAQEL